jgi:hypothetical protein
LGQGTALDLDAHLDYGIEDLWGYALSTSEAFVEVHAGALREALGNKAGLEGRDSAWLVSLAAGDKAAAKQFSRT